MNAQTLPFTPATISGGKFANGTQYYYVKIANAGYYLYVDDDLKHTSDKAQASQFAFVGDAANGFQIYAKGDAEKCVYLTNTTSTSVDNVNYGVSTTNCKWTLGSHGSADSPFYSFYQTGPYTTNSTLQCTLNYHTGSSTVWTWTHSNAPGSADCKIIFEVGDVETAELANITYQYQMNGSVVSSQDINAEVGAAFPDLTLPAYCTSSESKPEGTVSVGDANKTYTYNITWNGPFKYSSTIDDAKWYLMTLGKGDNNKLPVVRYVDGQNYMTLEQTDNTFSYAKNDQWAFVGNPFNGFKIYNRANNGRLIATTEITTDGAKTTFPYVSTEALPSNFTELWDIYEAVVGNGQTAIDGGFAIGEHGIVANKINRRWQKVTPNSITSDYRLAFWTTGSDNGSTFTVSQADLPDLSLNAFDGKTYASFYIDYPVKVTSDNVKVYTGTVSGNTLNMTKAEDKIIPAGVGVVLIGDDGGATTAALSIANSKGTLVKGSIEGTTVNLPITGYQDRYLVLGPSTDEVPTLGFYQPTATTIPAYKAYIPLTSGSVRGFNFNFDGTTTAIDNATLSTEKAQGIYDLSGRRVSKAGKGIYIMGGKKIYVK
ncbi:MAG: hypothetical protein PUD40_00950 [Bacteroidales bacterium]|nr:hypothetical protein [Bacteroidales bacterium]